MYCYKYTPHMWLTTIKAILSRRFRVRSISHRFVRGSDEKPERKKTDETMEPKNLVIDRFGKR